MFLFSFFVMFPFSLPETDQMKRKILIQLFGATHLYQTARVILQKSDINQKVNIGNFWRYTFVA